MGTVQTSFIWVCCSQEYDEECTEVPSRPVLCNADSFETVLCEDKKAAFAARNIG